jgi:MGT family glycosyltransferase
MTQLWRAHGLEPRPYAGTYDHLYLDIYPDSLKAAESPHIRDVQALRPAGAEGRGDVTPEDPPLVYVTFGTVFNTNVDLLRVVVEGIRELPVRVLVTCGPGRDVRALGDQPANVEVAEFIPQAEILPRCAAVVSHAGSGTFLAALGVGLPQLLLPQAADQFLNAAAGSGAGVGIAIDADRISVQAVRDAVGELLGSEAYRAAARRASLEISAMPGPEVVAEEIERRFG